MCSWRSGTLIPIGWPDRPHGPVNRKPVEKLDDETLILADQAEKAISQVRNSVFELLHDDFPREKAEELAKLLSEGTWTHDHPISCDEASRLGLNVSCQVPEEVFQMMALFPQPVRRQTAVEYLPGRRTKEKGS